MTKDRDTAQGRLERTERWRPRMLAIWAVVGVFVTAWLVIGALSFVEQALQLILVGGVVGFICSPLTNYLEDHHVPRGFAALIALLVFVICVVVLFCVIGGPLMAEFMVLLRSVPSYFEQAQASATEFWNSYGRSLDPRVEQTVTSLLNSASSMGISMASDVAKNLSTGLVENVTSMVEGLTTFFLGLVLAYWVVKDYPLMAREVVAIAGPDHAREVTLILAVLSRSTGGYMFGTLVTSIANGIFVAIGLAVVGHPYAGLVGALTFILHFVPVIGPMISALAATLLGLFVSPAVAVITLVIMVIAQNVADNVLSPLVMQRAVQIHPALSLVGIIVGGCLGGPVGMVIAVPLTAALRGLFVYFFETRSGRQIVSEHGALFQGHAWKDAKGNPIPALDALDDEDYFKASRLVAALPEKPGPDDAIHVEVDSVPEVGEDEKSAAPEK